MESRGIVSNDYFFNKSIINVIIQYCFPIMTSATVGIDCVRSLSQFTGITVFEAIP